MAGTIARPIPGPNPLSGLQSVVNAATNAAKTPPNKTPTAKAAAQLTALPFPSVSGGSGVTQWHEVVLWFLGAMALLALASPAPNIATLIVVILIVSLLLSQWDIYKTYLGLK